MVLSSDSIIIIGLRPPRKELFLIQIQNRLSIVKKILNERLVFFLDLLNSLDKINMKTLNN